ncbi:N-acetylmuramoyl-L-alanine amidase family protein [Pseudobutyrivibrio sp. MD2005]|uniref:N-acetylmuramoyl-L-alanine amidase family protein n=1 Tax=Pseudobutyrivibrio sp. MD2005 TaxID=1410616 RepID=UPI000688EE2D|nr:N-acetylmuramoyl-L-alanine amidase [Pseudobutyrivibrio sp. MD2005]
MKKTTKLKGRKCIVAMLLAVMVFPTMNVEAKQVTTADPTKIIVIDPSGQETANKRKEPVGPGAFKTTAETPTSENGAKTGCADYDINLQIALKLQDILKDQGYTVLLTRESNDVDISNSGRAMIANTAGADVFVVISGKENPGISVVCQSEDNPYNYGNYKDGRLLSDAIVGSVSQNTNTNDATVEEMDDKAAINWCEVPTAIVEVGAITNKNDEEKLVTDDYQSEMALGIANGIDSYFTQK